MKKLSTGAVSTGAGEGLLKTAEDLESEQRSLIEAAPIEQTYEESLAIYAQAKHEQVERIEDRLEDLVNQQQARLQNLQARGPGRLSMPSTRSAWQAARAQQQARLQTMRARLELVREIRDGMGLHSPRIEEIATRKMRADNPGLASDWDAMREAARRHKLFVQQQRKERERKQTQGRACSHSLGLSHKRI